LRDLPLAGNSVNDSLRYVLGRRRFSVETVTSMGFGPLVGRHIFSVRSDAPDITGRIFIWACHYHRIDLWIT